MQRFRLLALVFALTRCEAEKTITHPPNPNGLGSGIGISRVATLLHLISHTLKDQMTQERDCELGPKNLNQQS
jgi:hypothetical protein